MFTDMSVNQFLDALASKAPVPGGGSGAALGGALAAGLLSMVCNLTIGKKSYSDVEDEMKDILARSEELRKRLPDLLEEDTRVYSQVMDTYRMPKETEDEKASRTEAMQSALKNAAQVPMRIAECCARIIELCLPAAHKGNKWAVSDAGVAALMGEAALRSAALNVWINLGAITDEEFVKKESAKLEALLAGKSDLKEEVFSVVRAKL